jgi:hypothetical protein
MNRHDESIRNAGRRQLLHGALGLAAVAAAGRPAAAASFHARKMRLRIEGDVPSFDWVLSLYLPPVLEAGLPPGTTARFRVQYPAAERRARDVMDVSAFLAPAGIPPGVPAPVLAPISTVAMAVEAIMVTIATFGEPSTRPAKNVGILGRVLANDVESPFGSLLGRVATTTFGFDWTADSGAGAVFKLVAIGAAGSHVSVVPEAAGEIEFD